METTRCLMPEIMKILLIDEEEKDFSMIQALLDQAYSDRCTVEWVSTRQDAEKAVKHRRHDLYLLVHPFGEDDGLDLLRQMADEGLKRPMIVLSGRGSRGIDMQSPEPGATDSLAVRRFLGSITVAGDLTRLREASEIAGRGRQELQKQVEKKTKELEEIDAALTVLLRKQDEEKTELEKSMHCNIRAAISPFVAKLRNTPLSEEQMACLEAIESNLEKILSPCMQRLSASFHGLTAMEMQVVGMVRDGKANKEIASLLGLSENTVKFHRYNLRRKFGLRGERKNLKTFIALHEK